MQGHLARVWMGTLVKLARVFWSCDFILADWLRYTNVWYWYFASALRQDGVQIHIGEGGGALKHDKMHNPSPPLSQAP